MTDDPSDDESPNPLTPTQELAEAPTKPRPRRGSEKRARSRQITIRVSDAEYLQIEAAACEAGLSMGSFLRSRALAAPTTQARRRVPADVMALIRVQSELNRLATYLHELLRQGRLVESEDFRKIFQRYREAIAALMAALMKTFGHQLPAPGPGEYGEPEEEADDDGEGEEVA
jgi:hypothetical protein